jgi:hypothetical protein
MGNTNEVVAEFITEEKRQEILRREKKKKFCYLINKIKKIDSHFYLNDWDTCRYRKGGWGFVFDPCNTNTLQDLINFYTVRVIYHWYSNSKC